MPVAKKTTAAKRTPAKKAVPAANKYAIASTKGQRIELRLPSGNLCLVRRPGPTGLIKVGILDEVDVLSSLIQTDHIDRVDGKPSQAEQGLALMKDPTALKRAMWLIDKVVAYCVIEPALTLPVKLAPDGSPLLDGDGNEILLEDGERDQDVTYTDETDFDDRLFILQFVMGGSNDLTTFREGLGQAMGDVATIANVPLPS
jgi:hypothetical protein